MILRVPAVVSPASQGSRNRFREPRLADTCPLSTPPNQLPQIHRLRHQSLFLFRLCGLRQINAVDLRLVRQHL